MAEADTTKPQLTSLTFPGTINVTNGDVSAIFTAGATDVGSGVDRIAIALDRSYQASFALTSYVWIDGATDTFADGSSSQANLFKTTTAAGVYNIQNVLVYDKAGNYSVYSPAQLQALGIATSFNVTSSTAADTTKPQLTSLTFPGTINVTNGDVSAIFTAGATDVGSGVDRIAIALDRSYQASFALTSYVWIDGATDTFADGSSSQANLFKTTTAAGVYNIQNVLVYDKAGNYSVYSPAQLQALGIATNFTVADTNVAGTAGVGFSAQTSASFAEGDDAACPPSAPMAQI